jgi:hypothetical protein
MEKIKTSVKKFAARTSGNTSEILPFCEKAAPERGCPEKEGHAQISGQQLFSLFTADIIRQNRTFVR